MQKINNFDVLWKDIMNYLIGILFLSCFFLYWFVLEYFGEYNILSEVVDLINVLDFNIVGFGIFYILILCVIYFLIRFCIEKYVKALIIILPKAIALGNKKLILKQVRNDENTFSLHTCFSKINIDFPFNTDDNVLSLNGLVGDKNREEVSSNVSDIQIDNYLDTIRRWQDAMGGIGYDKITLLNEKEYNDYLNVFTKEKIRESINIVNEEINGKDNTFHFLGDKFGVFSAQKGKRGSLNLKIYKTNYLTFIVMNKLYSRTPVLQMIARRMCNCEKNQLEGYLLLFPFFASLGANILIEVLSARKGEGIIIQKRSKKTFGNVSQYHISVNEAFSFTDYDDGKPAFSKCVQRGIEEELGFNVEKLDNFKETCNQRIKYMDLFLNPSRGSLGISLVYKTDINPSFVTYYPGVDKVIESSKHFCVYGIGNYFQMTNFVSYYNWVPYTPYLLKRYSILKESGIRSLWTLWFMGKDSKSLFYRILFFKLSLSLIVFISCYYEIFRQNGLVSLLCPQIISSCLAFGLYNIIDKNRRYKIRKSNIEYKSLGGSQYKNVLLYTGDRKLEDKDIIISLKTHITLSLDDISKTLSNAYNYDCNDFLKELNINHSHTIDLKKDINYKVSWDNINIVSFKTGIRRISDENEIPSLFLSGFQSQQDPCVKLIVREYVIETCCDKVRIYYRIDKDVNNQKRCSFGFNHPFSFVFDLVDEINLLSDEYKDLSEDKFFKMVSDKKIMSSFAAEQYVKQGYNYFCRLKVSPKMENIDLCDVYQSSDGKAIFLSAKRREKTIDNFHDTDYIEGTERDICEKIFDLKEKNQIDEQDILMLQQILIRQNIKLFL